MLWYCRACTTAYSVGAPCCPHCGSNEYEENMAKISVHGGATDKTLPPVAEAATDETVAEIVIPDVVAEALVAPAPVVDEPRARRSRPVVETALPKPKEAADVVGAVPVDSEGSGSVAAGGPQPATGGLSE